VYQNVTCSVVGYISRVWNILSLASGDDAGEEFERCSRFQVPGG